jgi:hypothetical protein
MLHLNGASIRRPQPLRMHGKELQLQTEEWLAHARDVALGVPSVDYVGWHGEHFVVIRQHHHRNHHRHPAAAVPDACDDDAASGSGVGVELKDLPVRQRLDCGKGVDLGSEDAMWMERKDVPIDYERSGLES